MKQLKIAICDDERFAVDSVSGALEGLLRELGVRAEVVRFTSPKALLEHCEQEAPALAFLDIEMTGMDGIRLGEALKERFPEVDLIYVSNREDQVFNALRNRPFGFIRKKKFGKDLQDVMTAYLNQLRAQSEEKKLVVTTQQGRINVPVAAITYFEGGGTYQYLHLTGREEPIRVTSRMQKLEEELIPAGFLRIHKGYLVNFSYIERIGVGEVILSTGDCLPISRSKAQKVKSDFLALSREHGAMLF